MIIFLLLIYFISTNIWSKKSIMCQLRTSGPYIISSKLLLENNFLSLKIIGLSWFYSLHLNSKEDTNLKNELNKVAILTCRNDQWSCSKCRKSLQPSYDFSRRETSSSPLRPSCRTPSPSPSPFFVHPEIGRKGSVCRRTTTSARSTPTTRGKEPSSSSSAIFFANLRIVKFNFECCKLSVGLIKQLFLVKTGFGLTLCKDAYVDKYKLLDVFSHSHLTGCFRYR